MSGPLAAILVACPLLAGAAGLLGTRRRPAAARLLAVVAASASLLLATGLAVAVLTGWAAPVETAALLTPTGTIPVTIGVRVDTLSIAVGLAVAAVAVAVQVFSAGYLRGDPRYPGYAALVSLFTGAMLVVVFAGDLLVVYVGWEVMGVCSYFLIAHRWEKPANTAAAVKAFLMTRVGDMDFLFGIFVLGMAAGSFRVSDVVEAVPRMSDGELLAGALLVTFGVVAKSALFPLHSWLPDAMAGPAPVSALIHAATMVAAGVYIVAALYPVFLAAPAALAVLAVLAVVSMLGAALAALAADDLKRVLAYSTISQLSLMFAALAVGGTTAAVAHLLSHAAFKALLFLGAGAVITAVGSTLLRDMGGLRTAMPVTFVTMTIGFAALAGLPPTSGFVSKDAIVAAAENAAASPVGPVVTWAVLVSILLVIVLTAAYATRAWLRTFFGPSRTGLTATPAVLSGPLVVLAVPTMLLGLAAIGLPELRPHLSSALVSVGLAALGAAGAFLVWRREPDAPRSPLLASAFGTDDLYERTVAAATMRLAVRIVGVDDTVVVGAVTGTGRSAARVGGVLRRTQNGNPQFYLSVLLAGVVLLTIGLGVRW